MKILAIDSLQPGVTVEKLQPLLKEEAATAWKHYLGGSVREWYFRQDRPGAVLVMECESVGAAQKVIDELPLVKAGLIRFELIPLGPFMPLAMLFSEN